MSRWWCRNDEGDICHQAHISGGYPKNFMLHNGGVRTHVTREAVDNYPSSLSVVYPALLQMTTPLRDLTSGTGLSAVPRTAPPRVGARRTKRPERILGSWTDVELERRRRRSQGRRRTTKPILGLDVLQADVNAMLHNLDAAADDDEVAATEATETGVADTEAAVTQEFDAEAALKGPDEPPADSDAGEEAEESPAEADDDNDEGEPGNAEESEEEPAAESEEVSDDDQPSSDDPDDSVLPSSEGDSGSETSPEGSDSPDLPDDEDDVVVTGSTRRQPATPTATPQVEPTGEPRSTSRSGRRGRSLMTAEELAKDGASGGVSDIPTSAAEERAQIDAAIAASKQTLEDQLRRKAELDRQEEEEKKREAEAAAGQQGGEDPPAPRIFNVGKMTPATLERAVQLAVRPLNPVPWWGVDLPKIPLNEVVPSNQRHQAIRQLCEKYKDPKRALDLQAEWYHLAGDIRMGKITGEEALRVAKSKVMLSQWFGPALIKVERALRHAEDEEGKALIAEMAAAIAMEAIEHTAKLYWQRQNMAEDMAVRQGAFQVVHEHAKSQTSMVDYLRDELKGKAAEYSKLLDTLNNLSKNGSRASRSSEGDSKAPKPQKWNEKKGGVRAWVDEVAEYFELAGVKRSRWTTYAIAYLTGSTKKVAVHAKASYRDRTQARYMPWKEFKSFMLTRFDNPTFRTQRLQEFNSPGFRQERKEGVKSWLSRVQDVLSDISPDEMPSDMVQVKKFRDGLRSLALQGALQHKVVTQEGDDIDFANLEEIGKRAITAAGKNPTLYEEPDLVIRRGSGDDKGEKKRKGESGHWRHGKKPRDAKPKEWQSGPKVRKERKPERLWCSFCNKKSHRTQDCRKGPGGSEAPPALQQRGSGQGGRGGGQGRQSGGRGNWGPRGHGQGQQGGRPDNQQQQQQQPQRQQRQQQQQSQQGPR